MTTESAQELVDKLRDQQFVIEQQLRRCSKDDLEKVARGLGADISEDDTEVSMLRKIQGILDAATGEKKEQQFYNIIPLAPAGPIRTEIMSILSGNEDMKTERVKTEQNVSEVATLLKLMGLEAGSTTSSLRKECKISGTISREGQKDRINYINLCSQIKDAKSRGYVDDEISQAVRRAVAPGLELRTILDAQCDMPLETVLQFVRGFLQEKTASELYKDLHNMYQSENEDPQSFVLRAMGIREKIMKASESDTEAIKYDKDLIQAMFLQTIRTGLKDITVRSEVKDVLRTGTSDAGILTALNKASLEEDQRKSKRIDATRRRVRFDVQEVQEVQTSDASEEEVREGTGGDVSELANSVKLLVKEVSAMRKELDEMKGKQSLNPKTPSFKSKQYQKRGCAKCNEEGRANSCRHCWNCGAETHFAHHCPLNGQ